MISQFTFECFKKALCYGIVPAVTLATARATATASLLLDRYGVVTRGAVQSEGVPGGFAQVYRILAGFEERVARERDVTPTQAALPDGSHM